MLKSTFSRISQAFRPMDAIGVGQTAMTKALHHVDIPTKKATFAMSCFWAPDALFGATVGVIRTRVGYSGGTKINPTYVNMGDHTEAIEIDYDPQAIDYENLLDLFWQNHDPTAKCKTQYTSIIFYHDNEQKEAAEKTLSKQQKCYEKSIVTAIRPASTFYDAEDYHQKYRLQQHPWLCEALNCKGDLLKTSYVAARLNGYVIGCGGVAQYEAELPILGLDEKGGDYVKKLVTKHEGQGLIC